MEALRETTGGQFHPHTYLLDGTKLVAYIKANEAVPFYFKNPIKGFDKRGRKFDTVPTTPLNNSRKNQMKSQSKAVTVKPTRSIGTKPPVPVQDLHLEVSANTWQNMVDRMISGK